MTLHLDPNPCHRFPWPTPCAETYSGAHACSMSAGHAGACVCAACDAVAEDPDRWARELRRASKEAPTISLTNWASRRLHTSLRLSIMALPRTWEHGDGTVRVLRPDAADLRAWQDRRINEAEYRRRFESNLREVCGEFAPGRLLYHPYPNGGPIPVPDGATLLCACARGAPCHRRWAVPYLQRAGWRVVLDGVEQ